MSRGHGTRCGPSVPGVVLALALAVTPLAACQAPSIGVATPIESAVVIPMSVYHNRVYLAARVNSSGVLSAVLDNGASVSGVSDAIADRLHIQRSSRAPLVGNGDQRLTIELARDVTFHVGGVALREPVAAIVPLRPFVALEGRAVDAIVGKDLFARFVVDVDYDAGRLTLRDPRAFDYRGRGQVVPLHVSRDRSHAWMSGTITAAGGAVIPARLGLDMGTYSAVRLYAPFVREHALARAAKSTVATYGFGLGGEFPVTLARLTAASIGPVTIDHPVAELSTATSGATAGTDVDGTIGGAVLRHFHVIVDFARSRMILEGGHEIAAPFAADESGLLLSARGIGLDTIVVRHIARGSPAEAAGIRVGDVIRSVNGEPASRLGLEVLRTSFMRSAQYALEIGRAGATVKLTLTTRRLI
jgi:PDZ domain-containing protein/aspartyl protease